MVTDRFLARTIYIFSQGEYFNRFFISGFKSDAEKRGEGAF